MEKPTFPCREIFPIFSNSHKFTRRADKKLTNLTLNKICLQYPDAIECAIFIGEILYGVIGGGGEREKRAVIRTTRTMANDCQFCVYFLNYKYYIYTSCSVISISLQSVKSR